MISVSDPQLLLALQTSHVAVPRVTAIYGTEARGIVNVTDGQVTFDEASAVQGRCTLTIPVPDRVAAPDFDPRNLDVNGWRLFIEYGVAFSTTDIRYVPMGTFVLYDMDDADDGKLQITGYDTTVLLRDGRFPLPYSVAAGTNYETALETLAAAINLPANYPSTLYTTPLLLFQEGDDRLQKMQEMSSSCGWQTVADPYGLIVARPSATSADTSVVAEFVQGEGSHMVALARKRTRQQVYNVAVVVGEPSGATAPVYGIAYDLDPNSPTYYYGPFGVVPVFEKSQYITTTQQAQDAANGLLARKKGFGASVQITSWAHPTLRPGDPVHVRHSSLEVDQVIQLRSVQFGLRPGASMVAVTREGVVVT